MTFASPGEGPSRGLLRDCENLVKPIVKPMDHYTALNETSDGAPCIEGCAARASPDPTDERDGRTAAVTVDTV